MSRRLFLTEFGRRTLAVAVIGSGLAACSSDADTSGATTTEGPAAGGGPAADDAPTTEDAGAGGLRWERANYGFVSAYVLARGNEVAIVDTGTDGTQIETALTTLGFGWDDVGHVLVTHAHGDHIGGLDAVLTAAPSAIGYAGSGDIDKLSAPRDITAVDDGDEVFGLRILGTPGHTPGHISVFDAESGLLVAGDALIAEGGALAGPSEEFSEDIGQARASVGVLAESAPGAAAIDTILVGHGDPVVGSAGDQLAALALTGDG